MQMGTNRKWAPFAITLNNEYYDRIRVMLG